MQKNNRTCDEPLRSREGQVPEVLGHSRDEQKIRDTQTLTWSHLNRLTPLCSLLVV